MRAELDRRRALTLLGAAGVAACTPPARPDVLAALAGAAQSHVNGVWIWMEAFANTLRDAGLTVDILPNAALGSEPDRTELTALGLLQINDAGVTELAAYSQIYRAVTLPFLFDSMVHFDRFLSAPEFRAELDEELARVGLIFADVALLGGMSGLFTARTRVSDLSDLQTLRLRAMGRTDLLLIEALGASGVQVAWEEVPQALQTGIAQGYFNPPLAPVMFGHGSQIGHFTDLRIGAAHRAIVLSKRWFDTLTSETRAAVEAAIRAGRSANRSWAQIGLSREREALEGIGVETTVPLAADRDEFVERARLAYPRMAPPRAVEHILAIADETR